MQGATRSAIGGGTTRGRTALSLALALTLHAACGWIPRASPSLPASLSDAEFWTLSTTLSEAPGRFEHSDNLVSNEIRMVHVARMLRPEGGVYIGVGPEQNFSYIARLRPQIAFVIDIRQENRNLHLLYKALFELSPDRADFLSRLFSRERPPGLDGASTVQDLFAAYETAASARSLYDATIRLVRDRLAGTHRLPLSPRDFEWIEYALRAFHANGPAIHYGRFGANESPGPSYRALMTAADIVGHAQSYLADEDRFAFLKDLHGRNMIVPVVGDFAGPDAIRRTGDYMRQHRAVLKVFYGSNVEVYLTNQQRAAFCNNVAALPFNSRTWFIGSKDLRRLPAKLQTCPGAGR